MTTQTIKVLMIAQKNKPNADGKVPIFARITNDFKYQIYPEDKMIF